MNIEHDALIMSITWLAVVSPGADFAIITRNSTLYGRGAGVISAAGTACGCWVHVAYAIFGLTLVLRFIPDLFSSIRIAGACYLVYLGLSTAFSGSAAETASQKAGAYKPWRHYATAFLTNSLNPKTSIFVISLYSQVIGVETSLIGQIGWGAFISLSHFVWFAVVARFMSTQRIRGWILAKRRFFNGIVGALLTLFGLLLFMADDAVRPAGK